MLLLLQIGEIASRYQLHTLLPSQSALHICQKFQWTSEQLKSAYLDLQYFHRRSSKFPAEHLSLLLEWFTPFFITIILRYSILGRQLSFKRERCGVVPVQGPRSRISKTSHLKLKREVSDEKKIQDFDYVSDRRRRSREARNGFVKADVVK